MCKKLICLISFVWALGMSGQVSADLVGHWRLDETEGLTAADSSGYGNDGTLKNNDGTVMNMADTGWTVGIKDGALFLEDGQYVDFGNPPSLQFARDGTISAWVKMEPANEGVYMGIGGKLTSNPYEGYELVRHSDNVFRLWVRNTGGTDLTAISSNVTYTDTDWHHVVGVVDNNTGHLYVDGVKQAEEAAVEFVDTGDFAYIGKHYSNETARYWIGTIDDFRIYDHGLLASEIPAVMRGAPPECAKDPNPDNEQIDVPRDVVISWEPGDLANTHDVYLGTVFDDVNHADRNNPLGVLARQGQLTTTYDPGRLDFGQTYYWRIDEVNAPPDSTIFKGDVWSFTVELFAYPVENITATASSSAPDQGPENTVNDSGLDANDLHSVLGADMWLTALGDPRPAWIQYEFDKVLKLHEMWVWNQNTLMESILGVGSKDVTIEYSTNGTDFATLGTTHEFARAPGAGGYGPNTTVDFEGVAAKYVKLTPNNNWGGILDQYGLSEVRFLQIPVHAGKPSPDSDATDVNIEVILGFRAGREAAEHNVYLSTDEQAVIDGTAPVNTVTETGFVPSPLDLHTTYYWRVDEVNDAETPTTWQGNIWKFTTSDFRVVDDFESYNEIPFGEEGSNLVYETWIDGYANPSVNGATMGHTVPFEPSMERGTVYDGRQSGPLYYDNTTASMSEITANTSDLAVGSDWTVGSPQTLVLWVYGATDNVAQQMYVKVGSAKEPYDGDITDPSWSQWDIDLAGLGINLTNVTQLTIGLERIGAAGGSGMVLIDAIRLY